MAYTVRKAVSELRRRCWRKEQQKHNYDQFSKRDRACDGRFFRLGAPYADRQARRGYDPILVANNRGRLDGLANRFTCETGRAVEVVTADLNDKAELGRIETSLRTDASMAVLVNNAGFEATGPLLASDVDRMDDMITLNVRALTRLTYAVSPGFVARGGGGIINIPSIAGVAPEVLNGVYSRSKASVLVLSLSLHTEVAEKTWASRPFCPAQLPRMCGNGRGAGRASAERGRDAGRRHSRRRP